MKKISLKTKQISPFIVYSFTNPINHAAPAATEKVKPKYYKNV